MSDTGTLASVQTDDGYTVSSSHETQEQLTENLKPEPAPETTEPVQERETDPKLSKAASKLGKAGGEAAAAKRAEAKAKEEAETEGAENVLSTETAPKLGKPRDDPRARMLEATRKEAEAKREAARLAARVAELEAARETKPAKEETAPAPKGNEKPKADDFATYEEFVEALADWKADERLQKYQGEVEQRTRSAQIAEYTQKAVSSFQERVHKQIEADPSYVEKTAELAAALWPSFMREPGEPMRMSHFVADEIISSEQAPALMLHFSEHPEEIQRIVALPDPNQIQRAIARLEGRFERGLSAAPQAPAKPEASKAKAPVRPVTGSPHTADLDPDTASFDEWAERENAKEASRRR